MTERSGVEIDYCPKCRGVWLDRGELDKLIERAGDGVERFSPPPAPPAAYAPPPSAPPHPHHQPYPPNYNPNDDSKYGYPYSQQPKKRKSILKELFDF